MLSIKQLGRKLAVEDEAQNGAETIEIVLGIVLAIGLGAALLLFQGLLRDKVNETKNTFNTLFNNMISGWNTY